MGPLLHNREDSWRGLLSQFRCNTKQIMYITFSVCLHRHSLGVLGGKKHDNTTHISSTGYLQSLRLSQWKCEVFISFFFFFLQVTGGHFVICPFVKILQQEIFWSSVEQVFMNKRKCQCSSFYPCR